MFFFFFFFKQKTAYEIVDCDWSSDVCSSDLIEHASMDSLALKVPVQDLEAYLADVRHISYRDKEAFRKAKEDKASQGQRSITATKQELQSIASRNKNWCKHQDQPQG